MILQVLNPGALEMDSTPGQAIETVLRWRDLLPNRILGVIAIAMVLITLKDLFQLFPSLLSCLGRSKGNVNLEHSMGMSRTRNVLFAAFLLPYCLVADSIGLIRGPLFDRVPDNWSALATIGVPLLYLLVKLLAYTFFAPAKVSSEQATASRHVILNFTIILSITALLTLGVFATAGVGAEISRSVILWETAAFWFFSIVRSGQILASNCNGLTTILYLCALEILPAALTVCGIAMIKG
ncbi:MAG: DUF4271 domain-containing protein [Bacteroidales bacterium]|nr:DUF4271 domain-containing protein [Bacteroidales bacterium]